jgi:hypothetical protein
LITIYKTPVISWHISHLSSLYDLYDGCNQYSIDACYCTVNRISVAVSKLDFIWPSQKNRLFISLGTFSFIKAIGRNQPPSFFERFAETWLWGRCFNTGIDHLLAGRDILSLEVNQTPVK